MKYLQGGGREEGEGEDIVFVPAWKNEGMVEKS